MASASQPFKTNAQLLAIHLAVMNQPDDFIASQVLPEVYVGPKSTYEFYKRSDTGATYALKDVRAPRRGKLNELEIGEELLLGETKDYGYRTVIPVSDMLNAEELELKLIRQNDISHILKIAREKRVSDLVFNAASYKPTLRETLAGTSQWSHVDSNPVKAIDAAGLKMLVRFNTIVMGAEVWNEVKHNVNARKTIYGENSSKAISVSDFEEYFGAKILIGRAQYRSSAEGLPEAFARLWGKHCALLHINPNAQPKSLVSTFGWTARSGERSGYALEKFDDEEGLRGAWVIKSGDSLEERIADNNLGYFFQNAVA